MDILRFFGDEIKVYWGNYGFQGMFYLSLIFILLYDKDKLKKINTAWYSLCILLLVFNPITYMVCKYFLRTDNFMAYYARLFCLIPIPIFVAYGFCLLLNNVSGWRKMILVFAFMGIFAVSGSCVYNENWYTRADNVCKVPQDVLQLVDIFDEYENVSVMTSNELLPYIRQIDTKFQLAYNRNSEYELKGQLESDTPDVEMILQYAAQKNVDYVVAKNTENSRNLYSTYGCDVVGYTDNYIVLKAPRWVMTQYSDSSGNNAMFYTLKNMKKGTFIVIDGGWEDNEEQVRNVILKNGGVVDAWIVTHYHSDHIGAFNNIYSDPQGIEIKKVYDTRLSEKLYYSVAKEWDNVEEFKEYHLITDDKENVRHIKRDKTLRYDGLKITFLNCYDEYLIDGEDIPDNASLMFKVETGEDSVLFCGDCHSKWLSEILLEIYGEQLRAKYVQVGDHGNNSLPTEFYDMVQPEWALFDTFDRIMLGDLYSAGDLSNYFIENGVGVYDYTTTPNVIGLY